jgi:hypothetical protein
MRFRVSFPRGRDAKLADSAQLDFEVLPQHMPGFLMTCGTYNKHNRRYWPNRAVIGMMHFKAWPMASLSNAEAAPFCRVGVESAWGTTVQNWLASSYMLP